MTARTQLIPPTTTMHHTKSNAKRDSRLAILRVPSWRILLLVPIISMVLFWSYRVVLEVLVVPWSFEASRSMSTNDKSTSESSNLQLQETSIRIDKDDDGNWLTTTSYDTCGAGKERLVEILHHAGMGEISEEDCAMLPKWDEVVSLYGKEPVIIGLDRCSDFRKRLKKSEMAEPVVGGLFNTGTNAFQTSIHVNYYKKRLEDYRRGMYRLPLGKHTSLDSTLGFREVPIDYEKGNRLPIIFVRDPYRWASSMCRLPYDASWRRGIDDRCPNLVPNSRERQDVRFQDVDTFEVTVNLTRSITKILHEDGYNVTVESQIIESYPSLTDYWAQWNREYFEAAFPRLILRFEDTLFHAEYIMAKVTECVGRPLDGPYQYVTDSIKGSTKSSGGFLSALAKYGTFKGRLDGWRPNDVKYASTSPTFDRMMSLFHYPQAREAYSEASL